MVLAKQAVARQIELVDAAVTPDLLVGRGEGEFGRKNGQSRLRRIECGRREYILPT